MAHLGTEWQGESVAYLPVVPALEKKDGLVNGTVLIKQHL